MCTTVSEPTSARCIFRLSFFLRRMMGPSVFVPGDSPRKHWEQRLAIWSADGLIGVPKHKDAHLRRTRVYIWKMRVGDATSGEPTSLPSGTSQHQPRRRRAEAWEASCAAYSAFVTAHGHHPGHEDVWDGRRIGRWAVWQRWLRKSGDMSEERVTQLDSSGFAWDRHSARRARFLSAYLSFIAAHGRTPERYERWQGLGVGSWAEGQRNARREGRMQEAVFEALDEAGFCWESAQEVKWQESFAACSRFVEREGRMPGPGDVENGISVWEWARNQRKRLSLGALKNEMHRQQLEGLGFRRRADGCHSHAARWEAAFEAYSSFVEAHGRSPRQVESWDGINVGAWAAHQRRTRKRAKKGLSRERIVRLDEIGFEWSPARGPRPLACAGD